MNILFLSEIDGIFFDTFDKYMFSGIVTCNDSRYWSTSFYCIFMSVLAFLCIQQDKDFGSNVLYKAHNNPPAKVYTSLKAYQQYTLEKIYEGKDYFWASAPVAGDYIRFTFLKPLKVEK